MAFYRASGGSAGGTVFIGEDEDDELVVDIRKIENVALSDGSVKDIYINFGVRTVSEVQEDYS